MRPAGRFQNRYLLSCALSFLEIPIAGALTSASNAAADSKNKKKNRITKPYVRLRLDLSVILVPLFCTNK